MLPSLLYLSAVSLLAGAAAQQSFNESTELDISSCPITFYGQKYEQLYVNFTSQNFVICFNGFFDNEGTGDCLVGQQNLNEESVFSIRPGDVNSETTFLQNLPTIKNKQECTVNFLFQTGGQDAYLVLSNFGTQAAVYLRVNIIESVVFSIQVNGNTVETLNVTNTPESQPGLDLIDLSGCRYSGVLYNPGTFVSSDANTCSNVTCDQTAVLVTTGCGPLESCQGDNVCVRDTMVTCTVTGPTVIDFQGQVNSVEDRCGYSLLSTPVVPDFLLVANFQERRRKDVSFLDSLTLLPGTAGVQIHLKQGGRVLLGDTVLTLNRSAQVFQGVELSMDTTGVTANFLLSNYTVSVFFDGYTAQIYLQGPGGENLSLQGLCGNSNISLSALRLSDYSASGCEIQYTDTPDNTINCTVATERCNLLQEAPFTSCSSLIDPEPYITACIDTMCKYPAVDELNCQFLDAYDRACSLQNTDIADSWRTTTGCSHNAFCQDTTCISNEFCAERFVGGDTSCFCRAIFASKYTSIGALGDPTVCGPDSASVSLVGCLLVENGIDYSTLHLNDPTCTGQMDEQTHMVTFSFSNSNTCGTVVTANGSQIIYENTIVTLNVSSDMITRQDKARINFSCIHTQPDVQTMSFRIKDSSVTMQVKSEYWNYNVTMQAYIDPTLTQVLDSVTEVQLDQTIWLELETEGLEGSLVSVVTDSCWATNNPSGNESLRYDLIMNGCPNPADKTVTMQKNGVGLSNYFSFNMFQFAGTPGDIYLHCKVELCTEENNCAPVCQSGHRRRRANKRKYEGDAGAFITMAWIY